MEKLKDEIRSLIPAGQVTDVRTEQEIRLIWSAILKLAEAIDRLNEKKQDKPLILK